MYSQYESFKNIHKRIVAVRDEVENDKMNIFISNAEDDVSWFGLPGVRADICENIKQTFIQAGIPRCKSMEVFIWIVQFWTEVDVCAFIVL